ncbi:hypothetical protein [Nostoc sp.]
MPTSPGASETFVPRQFAQVGRAAQTTGSTLHFLIMNYELV